MHLLSPFSLNLPLYEHKKNVPRMCRNLVCFYSNTLVDRRIQWMGVVDVVVVAGSTSSPFNLPEPKAYESADSIQMTPASVRQHSSETTGSIKLKSHGDSLD